MSATTPESRFKKHLSVHSKEGSLVKHALQLALIRLVLRKCRHSELVTVSIESILLVVMCMRCLARTHLEIYIST